MNQAALATMLDNDFLLLETSRSGVSKESFVEIRNAFPFDVNEWEEIIGSDMPFEQGSFINGATAERLLLVAQIAQKGIGVFDGIQLLVFVARTIDYELLAKLIANFVRSQNIEFIACIK